MKKIMILAVLFCFAFHTPSFAFLYQVKPLSKEEVKKLSDQELTDLYTDAVIEREASETFHGRAGFTPKEYASYKELLGFIIRLRQEMVSRNVEPPPVSEWLQ